MLSLLAAVLVFGLIILFHEFGHFLFAKLGGICVLEFSLGMGPRLISFKRGDTRYSLKLLPFGGSCMMLGEDEDPEDFEEKAEKDIRRKSGLLLDEDEEEEEEAQNTLSSETGQDTCALEEEYGIPEEQGNEPPVRYAPDGTPVSGLAFHEAPILARFLTIAAGPVFNFILALACGIAVVAYAGCQPPEIVQVQAGSPAAEAGLQTGDVITRMIQYSAYELRYMVDLTFQSLKMLVTGQVSRKDVAGPVGIVVMIDQTVEASSSYGILTVFINLANMCLILSANLGIMNLLPIPALDGGRLVFILIEAVRGKPVDPEKEGMIHMAGMADGFDFV